MDALRPRPRPYARPVRRGVDPRHRRSADLHLLVADAAGRLRDGDPQRRPGDRRAAQACLRARRSASAGLTARTSAMDDFQGRDLLFIAGGIGLAPLRSAINFALDNRTDYGRIVDPLRQRRSVAAAVYRRTRTLDKPTRRSRFLETVDRPDAAWRGNAGVITTLIPEIKAHIDPSRTTRARRRAAGHVQVRDARTEEPGFASHDIVLSLERHMKCGVGKCGHCQIGGMYVCQEGPVVTYESHQRPAGGAVIHETESCFFRFFLL